MLQPGSWQAFSKASTLTFIKSSLNFWTLQFISYSSLSCQLQLLFFFFSDHFAMPTSYVSVKLDISLSFSLSPDQAFEKKNRNFLGLMRQSYTWAMRCTVVECCRSLNLDTWHLKRNNRASFKRNWSEHGTWGPPWKMTLEALLGYLPENCRCLSARACETSSHEANCNCNRDKECWWCAAVTFRSHQGTTTAAVPVHTKRHLLVHFEHSCYCLEKLLRGAHCSA